MVGRTFVVTGANKGIGLEIARKLVSGAQKHDIGTVIAATRNETAGRAVVSELSKLRTCRVEWESLDLGNDNSISKFVQTLGKKYGGVDVLINNAAISSARSAFDDTFDYESASRVITVNYVATLTLTHKVLPLIRPHGRVVFLSSRLGQLGGRYGKAIKARFADEDVSIPDVTQLTDEFLASVRAGTSERDGWPSSSYQVSKAAVNAAVRALVRENAYVTDNHILVVSTCPGWCRTDMGGRSASKTAEQGADTPVWCATTAEENLRNGSFYGERKRLSF